jgi:copper chaperone CopZ
VFDTAEYLHALDGRLRVKIAAVKGSSERARQIEQQLQRIEGIDQITANPTTGSVLILYDPRRLSQTAITEALKTVNLQSRETENRRARSVVKSAGSEQGGFGQELVKTVVRSTMEFALQRLVYALI